MWLTRGGLALVHQSRKEYEEALQLHRANVNLMKNKAKEDPMSISSADRLILATNMKGIGDCYDCLENPHDAYEAYREAWDTNAFLYHAVDKCLNYLNDQKRYQDFIGLLKDLQSTKISGKSYSHLDSYLETIHEYEDDVFFSASRTAARETGELQ